jgi:hypothetical protein
VANGIPFVGPAGTALERLGQEFGTGTMFGEWTVDSIVGGIQEALQQFDHHASRAAAAAEIWARKHGPARCVEAIMRLAGLRTTPLAASETGP